MKPYEVFLIKQIEAHDNTLTIVSWCFLAAWPLFLYLLFVIINMFISNSLPGATTYYTFPEWSVNAMGDYLNAIWILLCLLFIWTVINTIQFAYDILFGIYDAYYFRKWGENAY